MLFINFNGLWKNKSSAIVSRNISRLPVSCNFLNSNCIVSSKRFAKDEMVSTKNFSVTDVTKYSVNSKPCSKPLNNSKFLRNNQQNLGSNLRRVRIENSSRIIFGQIDITQS